MDEDELELQPQEPNSFFDGIGISISWVVPLSICQIWSYQEDVLLDLYWFILRYLVFLSKSRCQLSLVSNTISIKVLFIFILNFLSLLSPISSDFESVSCLLLLLLVFFCCSNAFPQIEGPKIHQFVTSQKFSYSVAKLGPCVEFHRVLAGLHSFLELAIQTSLDSDGIKF